MTVMQPATTMAKLLMAPSTSPITRPWRCPSVGGGADAKPDGHRVGDAKNFKQKLAENRPRDAVLMTPMMVMAVIPQAPP